MECSTEGCIRGVFAKGLCHNHYDAQRKAAAPRCARDGCGSNASKRGFCEPHYRKLLAEQAARCLIDGCGRAVVSKGLCDAHRRRRDKHGHLEPMRAADWGGRGRHPLYQSWAWQRRHNRLAPEWFDFWRFVADVGERPTRHRLTRGNPAQPIGPDNFVWQPLDLIIAEGADRREKQRLWQAAYRRKNPGKARSSKFKHAYGITLDEYEAMASAQGYRCAICGERETALHKVTLEPRNLAVDHCHATGKVRALLCTRCNGGLGNFNDDPELLRKAIAYLESHIAAPK